MAGVDVGSEGGKKRATNSDINMIPFIDLLMVTIAFLLITAVWVTSSRIATNVEVPGPASGCGADCTANTSKTLHVHVGEHAFNLIWKQGATVVRESQVPRTATLVGVESSQVARYPDLAKAIEAEWNHEGSHRDPGDRKPDQAVLHSDNNLPFREIVAVLDAVNATRRDMRLDGKTAQVSAFNTTFSAR
jgi:biopolymer transport protein ExbD